MSFKKKLMICMMTVAAAITVMIGSASACTMIYVGSDNTADGSTFLARSEDYSNSYNKIAYVSPAGENPADVVYEGCEGFTHAFSHDSYAYTAVRDDNLSGKCPDCGKTHKHTPMEECGTNEKSVSVSAMVTLSWNGKYSKVDPMVKTGIAESDMTTILLGEAATAKQGVDLLLNIYETQGAAERSGVLIADQNEAWYVENYTGHQYVAIKLSSGMIAISPNMGIIGLVDLDDSKNVIASEGVIKAAQDAGCFVGDAAANTIDFRASYSKLSSNSRMVNGLNYLAGEEKFTGETLTDADYTISNVKDGEIVALYTAITANHKLGVPDMVDFYKVKDIGNTGNLEWHIFQVRPEGKLETATVEWLGMENGQYTVAIPYYPVITTDMYEGYKVGGLGRPATVMTAPENMYGAFPSGKGYKVLPEGWDQGYYWSVDALSNFALSSACSEDDNAMVKAVLVGMQQKCYDKFVEMEGKIGSMSLDEAKAYATAESAALAKEAHELTLSLYKHIACGEHSYKAVIVDPTCTEGGYTKYVCCCGETYKDNYTEPAGHSYTAKVVAPTAAAMGYTEYTCTCGDSYKADYTVAAPTVSAGNKASTGKPMLTWGAVEGAVKYEVYRATSADGKFVKMFTTDGTSYCNTNSKAGEKYYYKVVAIAADGAQNGVSAVKSATCGCKQPTVTVKLNSGKPQLKWKAVDGASKYLIYRSTDGVNFVLWDNTTGTSFTNKNAKAGTTYYYQVKAVCAAGSAGNSAPSAAVSIKAK